MKRVEFSEIDLLVQLRSLMILDLVRKGVKQSQIGSALEMDPATISRMFPKGLLKDLSKGS